MWWNTSDRLLDLLREPQWTIPVPTVTKKLVKMSSTEEMVIVPETPHGPMLEIASKDESGDTVFKQRLNLAAVDDLIGRLIKMRDLMAQMKGDKE